MAVFLVSVGTVAVIYASIISFLRIDKKKKVIHYSLALLVALLSIFASVKLK